MYVRVYEEVVLSTLYYTSFILKYYFCILEVYFFEDGNGGGFDSDNENVMMM